MRGKNLESIKSVRNIEELKTMIMTQDVKIITNDSVYKLEDTFLQNMNLKFTQSEHSARIQ